jgi:hypothetical protein
MAFQQSKQTALTTAATQACGVGRVYHCHCCYFDVAGGCTALIKRSLVYHAYKKVFKELRT